VEQGGSQEIGVVMAGGEQPVHHVERVASVRDRHRSVQRECPVGQDATRELLLGRIDTGSNMGHRLHDPMHRSGLR
jgi:hypothetical protein